MLTKYLLPLLLFTFGILGSAYANEEPLRPDEAFQASATQLDENTLEAVWKITDKYYLYRGKFRFATDTPGVVLGEAEFPAGKKKKDPVFGEVETYRHNVTIKIPVTLNGPTPEAIDLKVTYQGCADLGICYPPQKKTLKVPFKAAPTSPAASSNQSAGLDVLSNLNASLAGAEDEELLPPDEAFALNARIDSSGTVLGDWVIANRYYMYKDKLKTEVLTPGISLGSPVFPPTTKHGDPAFGEVDIWRGPVTIKFPLKGDISKVEEVELKMTYQGCADMGVCYPPIRKTLKLSVPKETASSSAGLTAAPATAIPPAPATQPMVSEQDSIANQLASGNIFLTLLGFFGAGLLLAFTPCVFPMIPILSGIIVGDSGSITTRKAFMLSLAYVIAMALTYTLVGVLAGLFGANIQAWFQNPWVLSIFAGIFVLLSLSMFGFYELQMPAAIQSKLTSVSNSQQGGKLVSAAIMGVLSALIVGPCVTAPLIGALIYIGQTGDAVLGGMALFALGMGMGAPLLAIGASAGKLLPKAGMWMESVKAVFGVLMLALAIWLLERILPMPAILALSGLLLIVSGIYMGALSQIPEGKSDWYTLWKGVGFAMLLYGALMIIGASSGSRQFFMPLTGLSAPHSAAGAPAQSSQHLGFKPIKGLSGLNQELAQAKAAGKTVMVDFYADWCVSCKEMESLVFTDPEVNRTLSNTVLLQADVTANDEQDKALMKHFGIFGPPAILFYGTDGVERKGYRVVGFVAAPKFAAHAKTALFGS